MVADILTKALPKTKHIWCTHNFGVRTKELQWSYMTLEVRDQQVQEQVQKDRNMINQIELTKSML